MLRTDWGTYINLDQIRSMNITKADHEYSVRVDTADEDGVWILKTGFETLEEAREWLDKALMFPTTLRVVEL